MSTEMYADAELLKDLIYEDRLTPKVISAMTGTSVQTISDYTTGKTRNIPAVKFWVPLMHGVLRAGDKALFIRIYNVLLGTLPVHVTLHEPDRFLDDTADAINAAIDAMDAFNDQTKYLLAIVRDGRVNESDAEDVRSYLTAYAETLQRMAAIKNTIAARWREHQEAAS